MENNNTVRENIIAGAIELFMKFGARSVTMNDIASHLGISKKTIYQNFRDKKEIISLATDAYFDGRMAMVIDVEQRSSNAVEFLYNLNVDLKSRIRNTDMVVLNDLKKFYKEIWQKFKEKKHEVVFCSILKCLKSGISEGLFRENMNPEILACLHIGQFELACNEDYFPKEKFDIAEIHEQIFDHFIHGILSEKGMGMLETYNQKTI